MTIFSFDIVSDYDKSEIINVFDQVQREIQNRYDFKNTLASIEWLGSDRTGYKIIGNGEWQIDAILDIVRKKLASRNVSQKLLNTTQKAIIQNLKTSLEVTFKKGISQPDAKTITTIIRQHYPKAKAQINGEMIRVTSNSKNELQLIIQLLKSQGYDFPLQFTNYR